VERIVDCECGFEARSEDEGGLVAEVRRHARVAHGMALSAEEALLLAFRAEFDSESPVTPPEINARRTKEER